jgi:hypothetical protein
MEARRIVLHRSLGSLHRTKPDIMFPELFPCTVEGMEIVSPSEKASVIIVVKCVAQLSFPSDKILSLTP